MHPLLRLLLSQPGLLGEHAQGYAELLASELTSLRRATQRHLVWLVAAAIAATAALVLAGVAVLLWATLPTLPPGALWVCVATPAAPLAAALLCLLPLRSAAGDEAFVHLKQQLLLDLQLLQEVGSP
jgi:hypothetical protein